jgi:rare lipoprotein A
VREARDVRGYGWLATLGGALLLLAVGFVVGLLTGSLLEEPDLVARQLSGEATELPLPAAEEPAAGAATEPGTGAPAEPVVAAPAPAAARPAPAPAEGADPTPTDFDAGVDDERPTPASAAAATRVAADAAEEPADAPRAPVPPAEPVVAAAPPPKSPPPRSAEPPPVAARGPGYAVQVGAFSERAAAERLVSSLQDDRFAAYVVEGGPGEGARFRVRVGPFASRDDASGQATRLKQRRKLPTWVIREGGP